MYFLVFRWCNNIEFLSCFQLPCSRSRTNLTSPTNEGASPNQIGNSADIVNSNNGSSRQSGVNRGHSLTVANGVHDGPRRTLSLMAPETPSVDALVMPPPPPPPTEALKRAMSASEAVPEEDDSKTAAVLIVPVEASQGTKKRKKRRGREDATDLISDAAAEPILSKDTVV